MNSIRQLMDQGVAPMRTTYWGNDKPNSRCCVEMAIINEYNNIYGNISNTHMDLGPNMQPIITGSLISNQVEWAKFSCNKFYLGVEFPMPLIEWVETKGYKLFLGVLNGQVMFKLEPIEPITVIQNQNV